MSNHIVSSNKSVPKSFAKVAGVISLGLLVGCSTGTTYGTGVSQEAQLAEDVGGLFLLGTGNKKKKIDYSARPKLVKAPAGNELPAPAETVENGSAYFPTNPEEARAARLAELDGKIDRDGRTRVPTESEIAGLPDDGTGPRISRIRRNIDNSDRSPRADQDRAIVVNGRERRLARLKEVRGLGTGTKPRKYLTEPPKEYRTPAETTEAGKTGEKVFLPTDKRKKGFFSGWGRE